MLTVLLLAVFLLLNKCACTVGGAPSSLGPGLASPGNLDTFFDKRRRGSLVGYDLKITVIEDEPFVIVRDNDGDLMTQSQWYGFIPDLIEAVSKLAGFTYTLYLPTGLGPGSCNQPQGRRDLRNLTGNYGCGQRDTVENRTHMFFSLFYLTPSRVNVTFATTPYLWNTGLSILTIQEKSSNALHYAFLFLAPFDYTLWLTLVAMIPFAATIFYLLDEGAASQDFEWCESDRGGAVSWKSFKHNFLTSVWLSWSSATGANAHAPESRQGKLFSMFWTFFTLVIVAAYTANLAAYLQLDQSSIKVSSWDDLRDKDVKVCTQENTAYSDWLTENEPDIEQYQMSGSAKDFVRALETGICDAYVLVRVKGDVLVGDSQFCKTSDANGNLLVVGEPLDHGNQNMGAM